MTYIYDFLFAFAISSIFTYLWHRVYKKKPKPVIYHKFEWYDINEKPIPDDLEQYVLLANNERVEICKTEYLRYDKNGKIKHFLYEDVTHWSYPPSLPEKK